MRRGGYYLPVARLLDRQKQEISPLNWKLFDLPPTKPNAPTVFSCFSCAGGSTMGYKLAGFNVIGNNEIDRGINKIYIKNHKPRY
ncbi:MAG: DNA cytosine methyltransferase, partial [Firmicutes bacterium]|nr:DNA cytosine methyltransferase [Bacillota bacterium]